MVRVADWKLVYDMMGYGQLYDLHSDPCELTNLFGQSAHAEMQAQLMAELAMWIIRSQDSLPTGPQNTKYQTKWSTQHNWYAPYRCMRNFKLPKSTFSGSTSYTKQEWWSMHIAGRIALGTHEGQWLGGSRDRPERPHGNYASLARS
jgi:Domain of unknown function (DUF4976)